MVASSKYRLIVGLGNPGEGYESTYHNVGFLFIDFLSKEALFKSAKHFEYAEIGDTILVKPLTFMNESRRAVSSAAKRFKSKPQEMLIIHDDADIELGKYKVSTGRGSAGHKGVESIMKALGTKDFSRLRIGIRPKIRARAGDFVLKRISKGGWSVLRSTFKEIK